jgi:hypothetical protein
VLHRVPLPTLDVLPGGKEAAIEVDFTFEAAGTYPLRAKLESDRLPRDDDSIAVARVRDGLRVLVVDGDPGQGRFTGDSGFYSPPWRRKARCRRGSCRAGGSASSRRRSFATSTWS